jgi:hypothetical protein
MITPQLDRLKQDSLELDYYIARLQKEGDEKKKIPAIQRKKQFLQQFIDNLQNQAVVIAT